MHIHGGEILFKEHGDDDGDGDARDGGDGPHLVRFPNPHYVVGWGTEPLHRG